MPPTPKIKEMQKTAKVNNQQLFIFEGFKPSGLQIRIQRKQRHIPTPVKLDFDDGGSRFK